MASPSDANCLTAVLGNVTVVAFATPRKSKETVVSDIAVLVSCVTILLGMLRVAWLFATRTGTSTAELFAGIVGCVVVVGGLGVIGSGGVCDGGLGSDGGVVGVYGGGVAPATKKLIAALRLEFKKFAPSPIALTCIK